MLELASGTGRIASSLIREGAHYTGLDIVANFINFSTNKFSKQYKNFSFLEKDMREFDLKKK